MDMANFLLTEEQKMIQKMCREFVDDIVIPFVKANREREWIAPPDERFPAELLKASDKAGLRTLGVPEKYGGIQFEFPAQTFAIVAEELARGDSGLSDMLAQNWKVSVLLAACAPEHLQEVWFPRYLADPTFLFAHGLTEPRGASDRWLPYNVPEANMNTRATFDQGQWVLNGRKQFISNGYDAKLYVVYANTNLEAGVSDGTSSFLIPRDTPGFSVTKCNEKIGGRYMNNGEFVLENCRLPEDHLLVKDKAIQKAGVYFRPGKILQAAKNLGVGVAAYEDTIAFIRQHHQGGKKIIRHQVVAKTIAQMAIKLETVRSFTRHAARAVDENTSDSNLLCMMAKVYASEAVFDVCKQAMELHGGNGVMIEMGIEKHFRDAAIFLHMDGTNDIHYFKIMNNLYPETLGAYAGPEEGQ